MKMDNNEVSIAVDAIWEMRNPTRIKASEYEKNHVDILLKTRVEKIDTKLADIADAKELEEVWQ